MHEMTNLYDPDIKITQMYASPPVNNVQTINQNGSVFLVPSSGVPVSTQNTILIPSQTNDSYPMPTLSTNYPQFNSSRLWEQPVTPVLPHEPDPIPNDLYHSNCLGQLVGSYQIDVPNGDQLEIKLATQGDWQGAIVQRLGSVGDQWLIYDEDSRFTLCSLDDHVEAVMLKGRNTRHSLTWYRNDGTITLWRRIGNQSLAMNSQALRRISTEFSLPSVTENTAVFSTEVTSKEGSCSKPVLGQLNKDSEEVLCDSPTVSYPPENYANSLYNSRINQDFSFDLFDLLQEQCAKDPVVLEKFLCWGIARTPNRKVASKEIAELVSGRYWVNARLSEGVKEKCEKYQEILNEIKGAYEEVSTGVFVQPAPIPNEPGIQHRLRRSNFGYWIIEELNVERDAWLPCAYELPGGQWADSASGLNIYRIHIISMFDILDRMKDDWSEFEEIKKRIEFLFNSCNQKKLNTRLKPRSLKHHIVNLRLKLEKQYALSFAVRVANIADSIALERREVRKN